MISKFYELVVENVQDCEFWADTPQYEKLDIKYCLLCLIPQPYDTIDQYLRRRKEHNKKYKEFWSNTDKITFNADKTKYICAMLTQLDGKIK